MKKLLVILLLLFPVQSILGGNKIHIACDYEEDFESITWVIDFDNNKITGSSGYNMSGILINENYFLFEIPRAKLEKPLKRMRYKINRITGEATITGNFHGTERQRIIDGSCRKVSSKRKF